MDQEKRRLLLLIVSRLVLVSLLFFGVALLRPEQALLSRFFAFYTYLLSAVYLLLWKYGKGTALLYKIQFYADLAAVSLLTYFSGGIDTPFTPLYVLIIVYASLMRGREGGIQALVLSILSYGSVNVSYLVLIPDSRGVYHDAILRIFLTVLGLVTVAVLGVYLSERLKHTRSELGAARGSLQALKVLHQNIVNSIRSGLITFDLYGHITSLNHTAQEICGYRESEVLSQSFSTLFPQAVLERVLNSDFQKNPRALRIECEVKNKSGESRFLGMSCSPLFSEKGEKTGYVAALQDLTEIKQLEEKAQFRKKMAAIGELAAGLAHEIRNPLASIPGSIQILRSELQLSEENGRLFEIVLRESGRLNKIVEDFLIYAGPPPPTPKQSVNLSSLVQDTVSLFRNNPDLKESHAIVISPTQVPVHCLGYPDQLRQVVWNILQNGLRAMPQGGTLSIELRSEHLRTQMSFRDEGIGMSAEEKIKLFQPFHSGFKKGVGLGMAIVYQIVQQHQGLIDIESHRGKGTIVKIWLSANGEDQTGPLS